MRTLSVVLVSLCTGILTLANNDRIPMLRPNVTLQFEVEDLRNASPATVSRAGIIYVSEADLGWQPMATSWLATRKPEEAKELEGFFEKYLNPMLEFVLRECSPKMNCGEMGLVASLTTQLSARCAAQQYCGLLPEAPPPPPPPPPPLHIQLALQTRSTAEGVARYVRAHPFQVAAAAGSIFLADLLNLAVVLDRLDPVVRLAQAVVWPLLRGAGLVRRLLLRQRVKVAARDLERAARLRKLVLRKVL